MTYKAPGLLTRKVANPLMVGLSKLGVSVLGSRLLRVRGRTSGEWREVPVNLLTLDGQRYLVAPRGETQWVRNLRAADGHGELRQGRRTEAFVATEVTGSAAVPVLRAYLVRWAWEVGAFFDDVNAESPDEDLLAALPAHPIFAVAAA